MTIAGKADWPQTPDGTTDWEFVFEDAETGFIQLVMQSPNTDVLRQTTTVVIEKLFTRRLDEDEVARLKTQLAIILSESPELPVQQQGVTALLRGIKDTRIEKARIFVERKKAGATIDRRSGWLWKIDVLLRPKVLIPVSLIFVLSLTGAVYGLLNITVGPSRPKVIIAEPKTPPLVAANKAEAPKAEPEAKPEPEPAPEPKPEPEPEPEPEPAAEPEDEAATQEPVSVWLKTMRWPLSSLSTSERPQYFAVILHVKDWDTKVGVCRRVANVMDQLYQAFNHVLPQNRRVTDKEISDLSTVIPGAVNQIFGGKVIIGAEVHRYGAPGYKAATLPPYCQSQNKRSQNKR
ncbi:hypothetical protein V5T82_11515 [Magnetovibrio sp. PR-2]|uniref:hypothetical protein n=1 Tax=Magnetovibrio sp. PR-2 TaxID=3120356 RepID=UPI002FCE5279